MSKIFRWNCGAPLGCAAVMVLLSGCGGGAVSVDRPSVDGAAAAADALKTYDANGDQSLDATELAKAPGLLALVPSADGNSDGNVTSEELSTRFDQLMGSRASFANITVNVSLDTQPLSDATVKFVPLEIFGDSVPPAEATTDRSGAASPAIAADRLPAEAPAGLNIVFPGPYKVEITHAQTTLPERYNTATELGALVDPSSRDGTSYRFDLKSR
jgi:hypothetical protein